MAKCAADSLLLALGLTMEFIQKYYLDVLLKNYANYHGRIARYDFWMFIACHFAATLVLQILDRIIGLPILAGVYILATFVPLICIGIRRLHDIGRPGLHMLFGLIPIVGFILIYFYAQPSGPENEYGAVPKVDPQVPSF
ncbi:MAG: DUF805 domain-containing protein [Bradymonadales bacterium]